MDIDLSTSGRQWKTEAPGALHSMGLPRGEHGLATEQQLHRDGPRELGEKQELFQ